MLCESDSTRWTIRSIAGERATRPCEAIMLCRRLSSSSAGRTTTRYRARGSQWFETCCGITAAVSETRRALPAPQRRTARRPSSRRPFVSASRSVSAGPNSFAPTSSSIGLPSMEATVPGPAISSSVKLARRIRNSPSRTMAARPRASKTVSSVANPALSVAGRSDDRRGALRGAHERAFSSIIQVDRTSTPAL